ncbi:DMT family transporter [Aegicerativicinus sediminis]|uniref:DMT family transporter n=1 Tax=Aegicerativicinus sediminis TaxID=2893202 RepID=UPI001E388108|nr:DMT family transporter [Aegicerativicinus sediminis]
MSRTGAIIAAIIVQIIYGLNYTFANDVIDQGYIGPFGFIILRAVGACILFWILELIRPSEKLAPKDFKIVLWAAIFGVAINMLCFFKGLQYTTPIHGSVIMTIVPIVVLVLSAFMLNERLTKVRVAGVVLGFIGALILSIYGKPSQAGDNIPLGNFLIFINAASYSYYLIIIKKLINRYHPYTFIKWLFLMGSFMVVPFGYSELTDVNWGSFNGYIWFAVGFVIVGTTFLTYLLNPLALTKLRASTVSIFVYTQPVIAGAFAIAMGSDTLDVIKVLATMLIFLGVFLVSKPPH